MSHVYSKDTFLQGVPYFLENNKTNYNGNVQYAFTAEQGIKFPFVKRRVYIRNEMTSGLTVSYETEKGIRVTENVTSGDSTKSKERDQNRISIQPRATYNFSRNIRGGLTGSYDLTTFNITKEKVDIFRFDMWIEVIF
jgi:hypothetical protein